MQANSIVEIGVLTSTEKKVYCLNGVGKQTKEIADIMKSSYETAKSHMKNIKVKLGLQKDKEVTAHFWCSLVGKDFDEEKRQIMAACLLVIFILFIPFDQCWVRERRNFNNRAGKTIVARKNEFI
jgi:DNA-binding CsgD family transcriptional regulator